MDPIMLIKAIQKAIVTHNNWQLFNIYWRHPLRQMHPPPPPPLGAPRKIGWLLKTFILFVTKIYYIPYPIYDLTINSTPYL